MPLVRPKGQIGGGAGATLKVAGWGKSDITQTVFDTTLKTSYSKGQNTITIGEYTVKIVDAGTNMIVGGKTIPIGDRKQTIAILADGSAETR